MSKAVAIFEFAGGSSRVGWSSGSTDGFFIGGGDFFLPVGGGFGGERLLWDTFLMLPEFRSVLSLDRTLTPHMLSSSCYFFFLCSNSEAV